MRKGLGVKAKRLGAVFLSAAMLMTSVSTSGLTAYADENAEVAAEQETDEESKETKTEEKQSSEEEEGAETEESVGESEEDADEDSGKDTENDVKKDKSEEETDEQEREITSDEETQEETQTEDVDALVDTQNILDADSDEDEDAEGLIARYTFDGEEGHLTSGTKIKDVSESKHSYSAVVKGEGVTLEDNAAFLDGNAYIELDGDMFAGQDTMTISVWLQNETGSGNYAGMFFGTDANSHGYPTYYWILNPQDPKGKYKSVIIDKEDAPGPWNQEVGICGDKGNSVDTSSQWALYTTVISQNKITAYYNGKKVNSANRTLSIRNWGDDLKAYIGKSSYPDLLYKGGVRDVQIYDKAISADDVKDIYEQGIADMSSGLVAEWDFAHLEGEMADGTKVKDISDSETAYDAVIKGNNARLESGALSLPGGAYDSGAAYVELDGDIFEGQDNITISAWLKDSTGVGDYASMYFGTDDSTAKASWGTPMPAYYWLLNSHAKQQGYFKSVMSNGKNITVNPYEYETKMSDVTTDVDCWGMYTTVITKDKIYGYYNGELVSEDTHDKCKVSDWGNNLQAFIGRSAYHDAFYKGLVGDVQVYTKALDKKQVVELYKGTRDDYEDDTSSEGELMVHYTFEDMKGELSDGDVIKDKSDKHNDAKVVGKGAKVMRGALSLPGGAWNSGNAYIELPQGIFDGQDVLTISVMLQNGMGNGDKTAIYIGNNHTATNAMPIHYWLLNPMNANNKFKSVMTDGTNENAPYQTETTVSSTNTSTGWGLYTTVITKTQIKGFYNGKLVSTANHTLNISDFGTDLVAYLGKAGYKTDKLFNGQFRDVRVYNKALTKQEIEDIYEEDFGYEYPSVNIKATSVTIDGVKNGEEIGVAVGEKLTTTAKIVLNDGTTVDGYVNWDQDVSALAEGVYTVNGTVDYFPSPLVEQRADPYLTFDEETGLYFFCGSWPAYNNADNGYDRIALRVADSIEGIHDTEDHEIWHAHASGEQKYHIWAPEIHKIDGDWYVYYAASENGVWAIRPYVLKYTGKSSAECSSNEDFLKEFFKKSNWTESGQFLLKDGTTLESFSLDMTYFEADGQGYLVWADKYDGVSSLYIGKVDKEKPYQLTSDAVMITMPEYDWERVNEFVNEGPAVLQENGKIYLTFSASATGVEYCVGLLEADEDDDLLDIENWKKYPVPVLTGADVEGQYGPGHNSFSVDSQGNAVMVYHARDEKCNKNQCEWGNANSLYDPCRNAMVKYVRYTADGQPVFSNSAKNELGDLQNITITVNVGNLDQQGMLLAELKQLEIHNLDDVRGNLYLPTESPENGYPITWESSNEKIISNDGIVTRQKNDKTVILTATITKTIDGKTVYLEDGKTPLTATLDFEASVVKAPGEFNMSAYMFAYFTGEGYGNGEQIYFASSKDGLIWNELNDSQPVLTSSLGEKGVRDPFIMRSAEGDKFYLIATDLKINGGNGWTAAQDRGSKSLMIWESTDLVNWSDQRMVEVATEGAGCTWAPEAFYNEKTGDYMVFWASRIPSSQKVENNDSTHRIYYATTRDFYTFSEPKVWIELHDTSGNPISIIDTTVIKAGDTYYRFSKNEDGSRIHREGMPKAKYIILEKSKDLLGNWTEVTDTNLQDYTWLEGPTSFKFNGKNEWCLLLDDYGNGGYIPFTTDSIEGGQFKKLTKGKDYKYNTSREIRHGSVLPLTASEYKRIQQKWNSNYEDEFTLLTELPSYVETDSLATLPNKVQVEDIEGKTYTTKVEWKVTNGNLAKAGSMVTVEGQLVDYNDRSDIISTQVLVVSKNMKYMVDCGITDDSGKTSTAYELATEHSVLMNQSADAEFSEETGWGYTCKTGTKGYTGSYAEMLQSAHYGENDGSANVTYKLTLDKGIYDLTAGSTEYWGQNRTTDVVVSYEKADGSFYEEKIATMEVKGVNGARVEDYGTFEVTDDATVVTVTFAKAGNGDAGLVAYFAVTKVEQNADTEEPGGSGEEGENNKPADRETPSQTDSDIASNTSDTKKHSSKKKGTVNKNGTVVIRDDATALSNTMVRMISDDEKATVASQITANGIRVSEPDSIYTVLPDGAIIFRDGSAFTADQVMILVPSTVVLQDGRMIAADGTWLATLSDGMLVLTMDMVFHTVHSLTEASTVQGAVIELPVVTVTEPDEVQIASTQTQSDKFIIKENGSGITTSLQVMATARNNRMLIITVFCTILLATAFTAFIRRRKHTK